ncbi:hypothetical protein KsCSTR_27820 [Candidatus Kuenenia stuttgartiensis]|uniref:Uncharacterized protein n=1 Tax=Kuenenia stuttgartiensis TaxID=174633 RepID=Q1Q0P3_KUEST|nr:hypothetical protein KsCSTR_27820 [Candidatus Kuenenia stuttgartiensis]CAJ73577.1 unknown protein [Candidatus Kuenenia stuttgartiensis]
MVNHSVSESGEFSFRLLASARYSATLTACSRTFTSHFRFSRKAECSFRSDVLSLSLIQSDGRY